MNLGQDKTNLGQGKTNLGRSKMKNAPSQMRYGYTTGTCAQAAAKAAMEVLLTGENVSRSVVTLPSGDVLDLPVSDVTANYADAEDVLPVSVSCAVKKDAGDDPDVTDGVLVYVEVRKIDAPGVNLTAGEGIGHVTKPGLEVGVGEAAINRVPREMILKEVSDACEEAGYVGGIQVCVSIPGGEELAKKTFNPNLGIEGGLSILGTSGVVEPMSEQALIDTIRLDMQVKLAQGRHYLIAAPGNYGLDFLEKTYGISKEETVKCSNYIGPLIDMAGELGAKGLLLAGHIGKLVKVSGGIMNTHSKWADCRMELLASSALRAGIGGDVAGEMLECISTDDALSRCTEEERSRLMEVVMAQIEEHMAARADGSLIVGAITFSNVYGILGETNNAAELIRCYKEER